MSGRDGAITGFDACDGIIEDLDAIEKAVMEICPFEMQQRLCARKKEIKETKG